MSGFGDRSWHILNASTFVSKPRISAGFYKYNGRNSLYLRLNGTFSLKMDVYHIMDCYVVVHGILMGDNAVVDLHTYIYVRYPYCLCNATI